MLEEALPDTTPTNLSPFGENALVKLITVHDVNETTTIEKAIPIPLPTFVKKLIVFTCPDESFKTTKKELHKIAVEKTRIRRELIDRKIKRLGIENLADFISQDEITKNDIRAAIKRIKRLEDDFKKRSRDEEQTQVELLKEVKTILVNEYGEYPYKIRLKDGIYVKDKSEDESSFSLPHKISSDISKTAKFLNNVFTCLVLVGAILSLLAISFPFLGVLAAAVLTVGTIGICFCSIALSLKRLAKMMVNRFYFGIPIDEWKFLFNVCSLVISIIFIIVGISAFIPATDGGVINAFISHLPDVIKSLGAHVYALMIASKNYLEAKVSIEILANIWRIITALTQITCRVIFPCLSSLCRYISDFIHDCYCNNIYPHLPEVPPFVGTVANATSSAWSTVSDTASVVVTTVKDRASTALEHVSSLIS